MAWARYTVIVVVNSNNRCLFVIYDVVGVLLGKALISLFYIKFKFKLYYKYF